MNPKNVIVLYKDNSLWERGWEHDQGIERLIERLKFEMDSIKHVLLPPHYYFLADLIEADDNVWVLLSDERENIFPVVKYHNAYLFYPSNRALSMNYSRNVYFGNISFVLSGFFQDAGPSPTDYNNLERFSELKNNKNIYFYGRAEYGHRKEVFDALKRSGYIIVHEEIDLSKTNIMDRMVATDCFCAISIDGGSWSCFRDFELAHYCIPTIKISRGHNKCDLSYNDGFYIAKINDGKDIENAIEACKSDVSLGKSGKVANAKKYANGLYKLLRAQQVAKFSFVYAIEAVVRDHNIFKKLILNENLPSDSQDLAIFALNLDNWTGSKTKTFSKDILSKEDMSKINSLKKDNEIIVSYAGLYCPSKNIPPQEASTRKHYLVQAINWVCALERLDIHNYVIICLDKDTFEKLSEFTNHAILGSNLFVDQKRWLWRKRMLAVNQLIKNGFDVILSDLDAVWVKDPYKEFFSRPEDIVCQNISLGLEDQPKRVKIPLKDNTASMFCPGILRIRNNNQTANFWGDKVLGLREPDDQDALNQAVVNGKTKELFNNKEGVGLQVDNIELFAANLANSKFGIKHSRFNLAETVSKAKKFSDMAAVPRCFLTKEAYDYAKKILRSDAKAIKYQGAKLQDKWICEEIFPGLKGGHYVDIGASHPITGNNTYVLDKELEWAGISINADSKHKNKFLKERTCSTIQVKLKTSAIAETLEKLKAPKLIHYLNLNVKVAGPTALKNFPFDEFNVIAITLKHNNDLASKKILRQLLERKGYVKIKSWGDSSEGFVLKGFKPLKKSELVQGLGKGKVGKKGEHILIEADLLSGLTKKSAPIINKLINEQEEAISRNNLAIAKMEQTSLRKDRDLAKLKEADSKKRRTITKLKVDLMERQDMVQKKNEYIANQKRILVRRNEIMDGMVKRIENRDKKIESKDKKIERLLNSKAYKLGDTLLHPVKSLQNQAKKRERQNKDENS